MGILKLFRRMMTGLALAAVLGAGLLTACQSRLLYFPRAYDQEQVREFRKQGGQELEYTTSQGRQTTWLLLPRSGRPPERIWIVTAGNGSLALDLEELPRLSGFITRDAFVFFDYPGYGQCAGKPSPATIRASLQAARPLVAARCGIPEAQLGERGIVFGHSLGAAAALIAAEEYGIPRAVLLSPFTSTMDMTAVVLGVPLDWLVLHRFDNRARLKHLTGQGGRAWILHGVRDEVIPVTMSRILARDGGAAVTLTELPQSRHNTILADSLPAVLKAMTAAAGRD